MSDRISTWIPVYADVFTNEKVVAAAGRLTKGDDVHTLVGHLVNLWLWSIDHLEGGSFAHLSNRTIAQAAGWRRKPDMFVEVLTQEGLFDRDRRIHDWGFYVGRLVERRKTDAARKRRERAEKARSSEPPADVPVTSGRTVTDTVSDRTEEIQRESVSPAPFRETDVRVVKATKELLAIRGNGEDLHDCVLTPQEAESLVQKLLGRHDADIVFKAIESLSDVSEGFESNSRAGQTSGIVAWVDRQKPPLLATVKDLLARLDNPQDLLDQADIPDDGVEHASTESLRYLHELLKNSDARAELEATVPRTTLYSARRMTRGVRSSDA